MSRALTLALAVLSLAALSACPAPRPVTGPAKAKDPHVAPPPKVAGAVAKPDAGRVTGAKKAAGVACQASDECQSGTCEGQGCGAAHLGTCAPAKRMCTRDLRTYCGCDGKTFQGSGSCPGRRYKAVGPCQGPIKVNPK